ncbi:BSD domain-containing protein 1 [Cajanus cajan]|uniref:BSD domain-containing protein 1 n=1 Tax=Cajanus cajan TaxID=3821 RepID=UPI00098DC879|nr:BSD domain-containing protein 1 [Cajanus cajan]
MNLFKSVFLDEPDPPRPESGSNNAPRDKDPDPDSPPRSTTTDSAAADGWNFGGLFKTLSAKSESIIETYRRDLQEFGTGLKKEIEVAQGSLGTVGHVIDEFGNTVVKGTAQIISQGKDAILAVDLDSDSDNNSANRKSFDSNSVRYSRFDAQVRAIQGDVNTYSEEPEDLNEFNEWKLGFSLEGKSEEMEGFLRENDVMESVYKKVVPNSVDHETFWCRYYYKVYRLQKAEDVRARLVSGISGDEDLSWEIEDDDDGENVGEAKPVVVNKEVGGGENVDTKLHVGSNEGGTKKLDVEEESKVEKRENLLQSEEVGNNMDKSVEESGFVGETGGGSREISEEAGVAEASKSKVDDAVGKNDSTAESDEKVVKEKEGGDEKSSGKNNENNESSASAVEIQHSANEEEEDLGWDDIEDLSMIDEKKATTHSGSTSKVDLRKRLSAAEEEEDLSWDIEDDDEPAKA